MEHVLGKQKLLSLHHEYHIFLNVTLQLEYIIPECEKTNTHNKVILVNFHSE